MPDSTITITLHLRITVPADHCADQAASIVVMAAENNDQNYPIEWIEAGVGEPS